jgi:hypothetical protein
MNDVRWTQGQVFNFTPLIISRFRIKLMSRDPLQGHSDGQAWDDTVTSTSPSQSSSAVPSPPTRPVGLKEYASGKRIGRQCTRCRVYFVTEGIDEMKCSWCVKIDAGIADPVVIDPDQSIANEPESVAADGGELSTPGFSTLTCPYGHVWQSSRENPPICPVHGLLAQGYEK